MGERVVRMSGKEVCKVLMSGTNDMIRTDERE